MLSKFKILYLFENQDLVIAELQRLDLPEDAELSEVFHWLYFDKLSKAPIKLWFRSMDSSKDVEERYFEQGYLKFNKVQATFIEKFNSAQHTLDNRSDRKLKKEILDLVEDYLK